jgi:hypothetical protein
MPPTQEQGVQADDVHDAGEIISQPVERHPVKHYPVSVRDVLIGEVNNRRDGYNATDRCIFQPLGSQACPEFHFVPVRPPPSTEAHLEFAKFLPIGQEKTTEPGAWVAANWESADGWRPAAAGAFRQDRRQSGRHPGRHARRPSWRGCRPIALILLKATLDTRVPNGPHC